MRKRTIDRLTRKRVDGVFRYASPSSRKDVLNEVVSDFVEQTLGGSLSPFVAYLTRSTDVSDEELAELERVVASLQKQRTEP